MKSLYPILFVLSFLLLPLVGAAQIITTYAGGGTGPSLGDGGPATSAQLGYFGGIALDKHNNLYIPDGNNNRIRKVDFVTHIITTIAGNGIAGYSGDSSQAVNAELNGPTWVCFDTSDNLYITDGGNNRIRRVNLTTGIITTVAGNGAAAFSGDSSLAISASLSGPQGIAFDHLNNLYISDGGNQRIRKVNPQGIITTIAGNGNMGYSGDNGPALSCELSFMYGICTNLSNDVYAVDAGHGVVRKINASTGIITTIVGTGTSGFNGDGLLALSSQLHGPIAVECDHFDNIYIADYSNNRIRKVDISNGIVASVAGKGMAGFGGDNGLADSAMINRPEGVVLDLCDNLFIADFGNQRVRKVTFDTACNPAGVNNFLSQSSVNIYPNPANTQFTISCKATQDARAELYNIGGQLMRTVALKSNETNVSVSDLAAGVYVCRIISEGEGVIIKKVIVER